ncbi:MAG: hypothetical protein K2Q09_09880, partial [Phycisphaerales bacterium]|nr:hypothetical protein [Phycisphaerales bacterium]
MQTGRTSGVFLCLFVAAGTAVAVWEPPAAASSSRVPPTAPPGVAQPLTAGWNERASAFGDLEWITRPSRDATMSFTSPVEVREILAQPGARVKTGQLLVRARDGDIVAAVEAQRVR